MNPNTNPQNIITWHSKVAVLLIIICASTLSFYAGITIEHQNRINDALVQSQAPLSFTVVPEYSIDSIDPSVSLILQSKDFASDYDNTTHTFHRLVVRSTEFDPCLSLETIDLYSDKPNVVSSKRICSVVIGSTTQPVDHDVPVAEYSNINWNKNGIAYNLDITGEEGSLLKCLIADMKNPVAVCK